MLARSLLRVSSLRKVESMQKNNETGYKIAIAIVLAAVLGIFITAQMITDSDTLKLFIEEGGIVETLSAVGYFVCIILLATKSGAGYFRKYWYFFVALLAFGLRELDFDKRFTEVGIFKSKFLVSPEVSIMTKAIGLGIILFLVFTLITLLRTHAIRFTKTFFSMTCFEFSIVMAGAFLVISKSLDGLARKLKGFIEVSSEVKTMAGNMEEAMEFGVPCLFAIAIVVYFGRQKRIANQTIM